MANVYDVDPAELINKTAEELKKNNNIQPPAWAEFVKTGVHRERAPLNKDWWYIRVAAVLRTIYRAEGPIGVSKLRTKYGGKRRRGYRPPHFYKGSGNIIRKILQQLEKAGFLKKIEKEQNKGRIITKEGKSFLDKLATQLSKSHIVKKEAAAEKPAEPKAEHKKETKTENKQEKKEEPAQQ
jgi:small subunit ribosomal protein S19e